MSNRAIIAVVAWSFLTASLYWGWLHWSGAVTSEDRVIDGMDVHITTVHKTDSAMALIATGALWALGVTSIVLFSKRLGKSGATSFK